VLQDLAESSARQNARCPPCKFHVCLAPVVCMMGASDVFCATSACSFSTDMIKLLGTLHVRAGSDSCACSSQPTLHTVAGDTVMVAL